MPHTIIREVAGSADNGRTVIGFAGAFTSGWLSLWPLIPMLSAHFQRVVIVTYRWNFQPTGILGDAEQYLGDAENITVLGSSMGCLVGLDLVKQLQGKAKQALFILPAVNAESVIAPIGPTRHLARVPVPLLALANLLTPLWAIGSFVTWCINGPRALAEANTRQLWHMRLRVWTYPVSSILQQLSYIAGSDLSQDSQQLAWLHAGITIPCDKDGAVKPEGAALLQKLVGGSRAGLAHGCLHTDFAEKPSLWSHHIEQMIRWLRVHEVEAQ